MRKHHLHRHLHRLCKKSLHLRVIDIALGVYTLGVYTLGNYTLGGYTLGVYTLGVYTLRVYTFGDLQYETVK